MHINRSAPYKGGTIYGGHIQNTGDFKSDFKLKDFTDFAQRVLTEDREGDGLVKFGKFTDKNGTSKIVLRTPSFKLDGVFACDIKDPLFRTKKTKAVNNNVWTNFVDALIDKYGDRVDVRALAKSVTLADYVGDRNAAEIETSRAPVRLSRLRDMIQTNGTGKPLSAREILNIDTAINYPGVTGDQIKFINDWENTLRTVFDNPDFKALKEVEKVQKIKDGVYDLSMKVHQEMDRDNGIYNVLLKVSTDLESLDFQDFIDKHNDVDASFGRLLADTYKRVMKEFRVILPSKQNQNTVVEDWKGKLRTVFSNRYLLDQIDEVSKVTLELVGFLSQLSEASRPSEGVLSVVRKACKEMKENSLAANLSDCIDKVVKSVDAKLANDPLLKLIKKSFDEVKTNPNAH